MNATLDRIETHIIKLHYSRLLVHDIAAQRRRAAGEPVVLATSEYIGVVQDLGGET